MKAIFLFFAMVFSFLVTTPAFAQSTGKGNAFFTAQYDYSFAVQGGATGFKSLKAAGNNYLPSNAVITHAHYIVTEAFTSGGSATVAIGDAASGARYLAATAYNNAAFTANTPAAVAIGLPVLVSSANISNVGITIGTAALTGGKIRIVVYGYVPKGN